MWGCDFVLVLSQRGWSAPSPSVVSHGPRSSLTDGCAEMRLTASGLGEGAGELQAETPPLNSLPSPAASSNSDSYQALGHLY